MKKITNDQPLSSSNLNQTEWPHQMVASHDGADHTTGWLYPIGSGHADHYKISAFGGGK